MSRVLRVSPAARPRATCYLFLGKLYLIVGGSGFRLKQAEIRASSNVTKARLTAFNDHDWMQPARDPIGHPTLQKVGIFQLEIEDDEINLFKADIEALLVAADGNTTHVSTSVSTLPKIQNFQQRDHELLRLLTPMSAVDPNLIICAQRAIPSEPPIPKIGHFDEIIEGASSSHLSGWIANAASIEGYIIKDDLSVCVRTDDVHLSKRPDVTEHLRQNAITTTTEKHGTTFIVPNAKIHETANVYVFSLSDSGWNCLGFAEVSPRSSSAENRRNYFNVMCATGFPTPRLAKRLARGLLRNEVHEISFDVQVIKNTKSRPRLSIVVPLYGDEIFTKSLAVLAARAGPDIEWIFVVDDPRLHDTVLTWMRSRRDAFQGCLVVVLNEKNYGYATSNNIGVRNTNSSLLLLANSDVWWNSDDWLDRSIALIESKSFDVLGYQLLFEDGTIQHRGLDVLPYREFHDLFIVDHLEKGLPANAISGPAIEQSIGVTGAMIMLPRKQFEAVGGFDNAYIRGDFEDADLCLKLKKRGLRIGLVNTMEIYHLERQSMRHSGSDIEKQLRTYVNCIEFNERWAKQLRQQRRKAVQ